MKINSPLPRVKSLIHEEPGDIDQLDKVKSGQLNITELSIEEQLKVAKQIQNNSLVSIPEDVVPKIQRKNGYDQITYKWTDGTLPNWRVDRKVPGFAGGKDPVTGTKIPGYPAINEVIISPPNAPTYYISKEAWEAATSAYLKGTTTETQREILRWGHIITD